MNGHQPAIKSLGEVALRVENLESMQNFYTEVFGLEVMKRLPHAAFLKIASDYGSHTQVLVLFDRSATPEYPGLSHEMTPLNHFALTIDLADYTAWKKRLEELGLSVLAKEQRGFAWRALFFDDPEGNVVELVCYDESVPEAEQARRWAMSDELEVTLTPEEKLQKAQGQFNAQVLAAILYLKERGLSVDEFWDFVGRRLVRGWDPKLGAIEFAKIEAAFIISLGCSLRSLSGDEAQDEAVFTPWPADADWTSEGFLSFFGLSQEDADTIWDMYGPIASHLGLEYHWPRAGDEVTLTFTRRQ